MTLGSTVDSPVRGGHAQLTFKSLGVHWWTSVDFVYVLYSCMWLIYAGLFVVFSR